jgi:hypothetical protein
LLNGGFAALLAGNPLPLYPPPPHCNPRGLTDLGAYVIDQMIKQHFLIQTDHMSSKTADAAVAIAEKQHYSGVISAHCCSSPQLFRRIYATGGFVNPNTNPAVAHAGKWKEDKAVASHKYVFGFGFGSDLNGLGGQPGPDSAHSISYPFKSYDGRVSFDRERWGERTFDLNKDGLANYGLYADWLQLLQQVASHEMVTDMFNGAEAYLQTWERAEGVSATSCRPGGEQFTSAGLGSAIRLGDGTITALRRAGQPSSRPGRSYRYCVTGRSGAVTSLFDAGGQIALIASTASGNSAGGIGPGATARQVRSRARQLMPGVWVGSPLRGGARYLYGIRSGRLRFVVIATADELRSSKARLRADLQAAGL